MALFWISTFWNSAGFSRRVCPCIISCWVLGLPGSLQLKRIPSRTPRRRIVFESQLIRPHRHQSWGPAQKSNSTRAEIQAKSDLASYASLCVCAFKWRGAAAVPCPYPHPHPHPCPLYPVPPVGRHPWPGLDSQRKKFHS